MENLLITVFQEWFQNSASNLSNTECAFEMFKIQYGTLTREKKVYVKIQKIQADITIY